MGGIKEMACTASITAKLSPSSVINARMLSTGGVISARMMSNRIRTQERTVVPQPQDQVIPPDTGYDGFAKVAEIIPAHAGLTHWMTSSTTEARWSR